MRTYRVALLGGLLLCLSACGTVLDPQAHRYRCSPGDWCVDGGKSLHDLSASGGWG